MMLLGRYKFQKYLVSIHKLIDIIQVSTNVYTTEVFHISIITCSIIVIKKKPWIEKEMLYA